MHLLTRRLCATIKAGKLFYHPHQLSGKGKGGGLFSIAPSYRGKYARYIQNISKTTVSPLLREVTEFQQTI